MSQAGAGHHVTRLNRNRQVGLLAVLAVLLAMAPGACTQVSARQSTATQPATAQPVAEKPAPTTAPAVTSDATRAPTTQPATTQPAEHGKCVEYAPHVSIDWSVPQVEVDAKVVLRDGLIELLACSMNTKEHESILVTPARPLRIYEALRLIGLEPGRPVSYDAANDKAIPPTGQRLALDIIYHDENGEQTIVPHEWMANSKTLEPIEALPWIFTGSVRSDGSFGADVEGTVACVVDFTTALIGLSTMHTSSDAELWLIANKTAIPKIGTPCTLVIRKLEDDPIILSLTPEGYFWWGDEILSPLELDDLIRRRIRHNPNQDVELSPMEGASDLFTRVAGRAIVGSGIKPDHITLHLREPIETTTQPSTPPTKPGAEQSIGSPAIEAGTRPSTQPSTP
jgi:hypothetical protein